MATNEIVGDGFPVPQGKESVLARREYFFGVRLQFPREGVPAALRKSLPDE